MTCEDCVRCETLKKKKSQNNFPIPKELLSECEELDEEREKWKLIQNTVYVSKEFGLFSFFFSAVLPDSWLLH